MLHDKIDYTFNCSFNLSCQLNIKINIKSTASNAIENLRSNIRKKQTQKSYKRSIDENELMVMKQNKVHVYSIDNEPLFPKNDLRKFYFYETIPISPIIVPGLIVYMDDVRIGDIIRPVNVYGIFISEMRYGDDGNITHISGSPHFMKTKINAIKSGKQLSSRYTVQVLGRSSLVLPHDQNFDGTTTDLPTTTETTEKTTTTTESTTTTVPTTTTTTEPTTTTATTTTTTTTEPTTTTTTPTTTTTTTTTEPTTTTQEPPIGELKISYTNKTNKVMMSKFIIVLMIIISINL